MAQFTVKLEKQNLATLSMIDNLKTLGCFVDVSLVCEGHTVKAHKLVLAAGSPFFQQLFLENPCQHPIIIMQDVRYTILKEVIRFLYTGELSVSSQSLKALLKTVKTLDVKVLIDLCNESLRTSNSLDSMSFREYDPVEIAHLQKEPPQSTSMPVSQNTDQTVSSNCEVMTNQLPVKTEPPTSPLASSVFFPQSANKSDSEVIIGPHPLQAKIVQSQNSELLPRISDTRTLNSQEEHAEQAVVEESLMENVACEYDDNDMAEGSDISNQNQTTITRPVLLPAVSGGSSSNVAAGLIYNKRRNRRSRLWQHFKAVDGTFAKCTYCHAQLSYRTTISNLARHLQTKHSIPS